MIYIVMGVSGCGKTTIGSALANRLGIPFYDADDFHPECNKKKMAEGFPLTDADRWPWLRELTKQMTLWQKEGDAILACSALKEAYRDTLRTSGPTQFIYLKAGRNTLMSRLTNRTNHFMPPELLASQLDTLEEPSHAWTVTADRSVNQIIQSIITIKNNG